MKDGHSGKGKKTSGQTGGFNNEKRNKAHSPARHFTCVLLNQYSEELLHLSAVVLSCRRNEKQLVRLRLTIRLPVTPSGLLNVMKSYRTSFQD